MDIYEYCAEMMMNTDLAKYGKWTYDEVLGRFRGKYPDEMDFREEMRRLEKLSQEILNVNYSWIDDFDRIEKMKCPEELHDVEEVLKRGRKILDE